VVSARWTRTVSTTERLFTSLMVSLCQVVQARLRVVSTHLLVLIPQV